MKKLIICTLAGCLAAGAWATSAQAARKTLVPPTPLRSLLTAPLVSQTELQPVPEAPGSPVAAAPMAHDYTPLDAAPAAVPMFCNVRYVDKREMAPCAVTKVIMVPDPCQPKDACCQKCVAIEICVPPCGCEEIKCNRAGNRIRYCYGDYAVDVRIRKGLIVVDYQD